jgi:hypothetical protein
LLHSPLLKIPIQSILSALNWSQSTIPSPFHWTIHFNILLLLHIETIRCKREAALDLYLFKLQLMLLHWLWMTQPDATVTNIRA